jgi:hypothetical protein
MTLDAVRLEKCKFVTLAANEAFYGRYFYIGTVRYASPIDEGGGKGKEYILTDVIGYVHDIGPAFQSNNCSRWNTCQDISRKFDVAVGDFRGWNSRNASQFVDGQQFCRNFSTTFYQIGGAPVSPPQVTSQVTGNNNIAIVPGSPLGTNFGPFGLGIQPYTPPGGIASLSSAQGASSRVGATSGTGAVPTRASLSGTSPFGVSIGATSDAVSTTAFDGTSGLSASTIVIQPNNAREGSNILVSWTSVNMKPSLCQVTKNGADFASGNEATKRDVIEGTTEYVLECTTPSGETAISKVNLTI